MPYQTLLEPTSPRLAELEARLGPGKPKPERLYRLEGRRCKDGRRRGIRIPISNPELEGWFLASLERNETTECWEWSLDDRLTSEGYGQFKIYKMHWMAHRFMAKLVIGTIPALCVLHTCDNPSCCNPSHLFLGTNKDNTQDMLSKGRCNPIKNEAHCRAKLSWNDVQEIRSIGNSQPQRSLARKFGVSQNAISLILRNKNWKI